MSTRNASPLTGSGGGNVTSKYAAKVLRKREGQVYVSSVPVGDYVRGGNHNESRTWHQCEYFLFFRVRMGDGPQILLARKSAHEEDPRFDLPYWRNPKAYFADKEARVRHGMQLIQFLSGNEQIQVQQSYEEMDHGVVPGNLIRDRTLFGPGGYNIGSVNILNPENPEFLGPWTVTMFDEEHTVQWHKVGSLEKWDLFPRAQRIIPYLARPLHRILKDFPGSRYEKIREMYDRILT